MATLVFPPHWSKLSAQEKYQNKNNCFMEVFYVVDDGESLVLLFNLVSKSSTYLAM